MTPSLRALLAHTYILPKRDDVALCQVMPDHAQSSRLCFTSGVQNAPVPSSRAVRRRVQKIARNGATGVVFVGNDPLFRSDLAQLLKYAKERHGLETAIATNTLLYDREMMEACYPYLDVLHIPLDADNESVSVMHRAPHQFSHAIATLSDLRDAPVRVEVSTLLTRLNEDSVVGISKYLKDVATVWRIFQHVPSGVFDFSQFAVSQTSFHRIAEAIEVNMRDSSTSVRMYWEFDDAQSLFQTVSY